MSQNNSHTSGDPSIIQFFQNLALAFATAGATVLFTAGSLLGIAGIAVAIPLYILGRKWSVVSTHTGNQFVHIVHSIARHRNVLLWLVIVGFGVYAARFVYNIRSD